LRGKNDKARTQTTASANERNGEQSTQEQRLMVGLSLHPSYFQIVDNIYNYLELRWMQT